MKTVYLCEVCGKQFNYISSAESCEKTHLSESNRNVNNFSVCEIVDTTPVHTSPSKYPMEITVGKVGAIHTARYVYKR